MKYRLFIMRHFKTYANKNDIYMGQMNWPIDYENICFDNTPLSSIDNCCIISSPLLRALQSAKYVIKETDRIKWELESVECIKERGLGEFEGKIKSSINNNPIYFHNRKLILHSTPPKGENIIDFYNRVNQIKPYLSDRLQKNNVLLVTHLQVLRALFCTNLSEKTWYDMSFDNGKIEEVDINEIL